MYKKLYFIGIGGIGMSALARYYSKRGVAVYGYDKTKTELTECLEKEGMKIHYEDRIDFIPDNLDLAIITPAIPMDLLEYQHLLKLNIPVLKRSQVLGQITSIENNIAVAGTHGKTTTSVLIAHILFDSGIGITAFLGGIALNYKTNFLDNGSAWVVEEADEYDRSFLNLHPSIAIIGSLDADHLDIYGSREQMVENYLRFASQIKGNGILLMSDTIDPTEIQLFKNTCVGHRVMRYGFNNSEVKVTIVGTEKGWTTFNYISDNVNMLNLAIRLPGQHNIRNTAAAIRVALELGISEDQIRSSILNFKGIKRRFEWIYETEDKVLIDDYAHHPEELRAVISACRDAYPARKITGIFQPHLYSRTRDFMEDFAAVLAHLDVIILVELYPARELEIPGISSETLFLKIKHPNKHLSLKKNLCNLIETLEMDVVLCLGAGDLDMMMDEIKDAVFGSTDLKKSA
ncbi:MAG: UDP-N-acetylmuramate--L-alanine ligase [Saprospiraceae bacterium]|nr:UDP-N-acetylmuramate--L-alanine ligase [Saprospiraceae bacterium]